MAINKKTHTQNFFGESIIIIDSTDKNLIGTKGVVVDETLNSFLLSTKKGLKRVLKNIIIFEFNKEKFNGKNMIKRFENRIQR